MKLLMLLQNIELRERGNTVLNVSTQVIDILSGGKLSTVNRTTGMNTIGLISQLGLMNHSIENKKGS